MSETKFTKGPYRAEGPDMFGDWNILHPADSLAVGAVVSNMRPAEEVAANANLFGAATDLYEAAEFAEKTLAALVEIPGVVTHPAIDMLRAARARARGESLEGK